MPLDRIEREAADAAAVVRSRRSPGVIRWFVRYADWYLGRNFHAVRIADDGLPLLPQGRPAIVYANHPSWWDPLLFVATANRFFPARPAFGPMETSALRQYRFMERLGIFGIEPGTRAGAVAFLRIGSGLLADPRAMLWVTAEGRFTDARTRPIRLRPGLRHLAKRAPEAVLVPFAMEYPFWDERYPEALVRFGPPTEASDVGPGVLEDRLTETMDRLAEAAVARDPGRFRTLVSGNAGVGGTYDVWRRAKAALRGERFRSQHGDLGSDG